MEQRDARFSKMAREKGSDENGISFGYHPGHAPAEDEGGEVERGRRRRSSWIPERAERRNPFERHVQDSRCISSQHLPTCADIKKEREKRDAHSCPSRLIQHRETISF